MLLTTKLKLGYSTNILYGYQPIWNPETEESLPIFPSKKQPIKTFEPNIEVADTKWSFPYLSFHDDAKSLISTLYDYEIITDSNNNPTPEIPPGPLVLCDKDSETTLSLLQEKLGVDLNNNALSYVLVRLKREVGQVTYPANHSGTFDNSHINTLYVNNSDKDFKRLRSGKKLQGPNGLYTELTLNQAQGYADFFETYGTHYVSCIKAGDIIYQVFAYEKKEYTEIKKTYSNPHNPTEGPFAIDFNYYTTPKNDAGYGYVAQYGHLLIMSNDETFNKSIQSGNWFEAFWAKKNSIFAAYAKNSKVNLEDFKRVVPIGFSLSSLSYFAEHFRKENWDRLLKTMLYQKYRPDLHPIFDKVNKYDFDKVYPHEETGFISLLATPKINVFMPRIDASDLAFVAENEVTDFQVFTNLLEISDETPISIPGKKVYLLAHVINVISSSQIPEFTLRDEAMESYTLACEECLGTFVVTNRSQTKANVISDGLHFETVDGDYGRYLPKITRTICTMVEEDIIKRNEVNIEYSLTYSECHLNSVRNSENEDSKKTSHSILKLD